MASRPIYISTNIPEEPFIKMDVEFNWVKGMSYSQKGKRREIFFFYAHFLLTPQ